LKRLILMCLCLVMFVGLVVLPSAVLGGYVAPNADGVRVGQGIPFLLIPQEMKQCVTGYKNCFVNVWETGLWPSWSFPCTGGPYVICDTIHNEYRLLIPDHYDDWNSVCWFRGYDYLHGPCNYDPNTYDFDEDGTPDIADAKPDTPPSKLAKGCTGDNNNTAYDDQQAATQGASAPGG
jgi:hypothetical protein